MVLNGMGWDFPTLVQLISDELEVYRILYLSKLCLCLNQTMQYLHRDYNLGALIMRMVVHASYHNGYNYQMGLYMFFIEMEDIVVDGVGDIKPLLMVVQTGVIIQKFYQDFLMHFSEKE